MKRFPMVGVILLIPALAGFVLVGCTKDTGKTEKTTTATTTENKDGAKGATEITTATKATVKGTVKLKGDAKAKSIAATITKHSDGAYCMKGDSTDQSWHVNNDGMVQNVVVWLSAPEGKAFKLTDELKSPFKKKLVVMDQPHCQFIPHIAAVFADVQEFQVKNSATITHNTKVTGDAKNGSTNENLAPGKSTKARTYGMQKTPIAINCDQHTWMNAKLFTFNHPYFAVTNDKGEFVIENVPITEELIVNIWHEAAGDSTQKATFKEGENSLPLTVSPK